MCKLTKEEFRLLNKVVQNVLVSNNNVQLRDIIMWVGYFIQDKL